MPKRKRRHVKSRSTKRRRTRRRRRTNTVYLSKGPIATRTLAKLAYVQHNQLNAGVGLLATQVFVSNDLRDPDSTGGGHQPMAFDQLMASYDHFTALSAKITVTFTNTGSVPALCAIHHNAISTDQATSPSELMERQRTVYKMLGTSGSGPMSTQLSYKVSLRKFFSQKALVGEANYRGSASTSPTEKAFFYVTVTDPVGANAVTVNCICKIEYFAAFTEPKTFGQS